MTGPRVLLPDGHQSVRRPLSEVAGRALLVAGALATGIAIGVVDFRTGETMLTAALIGFIAFGLTVIRPVRALGRALLVALGVPLVYIWATIADAPIVYPPTPNLAATLLALLPAVLGTLLGRFARRLLLASPARRRR